MAKYISGRVKDLKVGVSGYSESKVTLNVVGTVSANDIVIGDGSETGISSSSIKVGTAITMDAASGIISAKSFRGPSGINATFVGDGSGLTGVVGSGSGVIVYDGNDAVGTAGTINFGTNLSVSDISAGVVTVTASIPSTDNATNLLGGFARASELDVSGISTFVGIATFNNGLHVISGVTTVDSSLEVGSAITAYSSDGSIHANRYYGDGQYLTGIQATGNVSATSINVTGLSTFVGVSTFNDGLIVHAGITTLSDTLEVGTAITAHAGIITATKFDGNATGLTGAPNIDVTSIVGSALSFTGIATLTDAWMRPATLKIGTGITASGGIITATTIDVSGIVGTALSVGGMSTFTGITTFNDNVFVGSAITMFSATGIVSATKFVGDGSQLVNVSASGQGVQVRNSGISVGAAGTIDFGSSLSANLTDGVATITGIGTQFIKSESINVTGLSTFVGLSTFNDGLIVTSGITTVGFITANDLSVSGVITATTFKGALTGDVTGTVNTASQPNITTVGTLGSLNVTGNVGIGTTIFTDAVQQSNNSVLAVGILTAYEIYSSVYGKFTGSSVTADKIVGTALSISGIGTVGDTLKVGTAITAHAGIITATKFNVYGGSSSQFLKADGTLDSTDYAGSTDRVVGTALSISGIGTVADTLKVGIAITAHAGIITATTFAGDPSNENANSTWSIGGGSGSGYQFTGPGQDGSEGNPDLYLVRGQKYRFINTTGTDHPFVFRNDANDADYTDGVTGSRIGTQYLNVQHDAPPVLRYRCSVHTGSMLGKIYIVGGEQFISGIITATTFSGNLVGTGLTISGIGTIGDTLKVGTGITAHAGIITATTFVGGLTGNVSGDATGLSGTPNITVENLVGSASSISGIGTIGDTLKVGTAITAHAGIITATTFSGAVTGDVTGNADTATALKTARNIGGVSFNGTGDITLPGVNASGTQDTSGTAAGLSGTPDITIRNLVGVAATFSGNVSIAGTLTYEDVTNVDSVGLVTAREGIHVIAGAGVSIADGGLNVTSGITTVGFITANNLFVSGIATISDTLKVGTGITAHAGVITATKFIVEGSNGFLKADGTINTGSFADGAISEIVDDDSPQLGGDLDGRSKSIHSIGIATITDTLKVGTAITAHAGIVTANSIDAAISEWVLGATGDNNNYTFIGPGLTGAENDPTIYLKRGQKYRFKNASGGHPFRIQYTFQDTSGSAYNDGITNNSANNGTTLIWDVQFDAPEVLYYQCTSHTNMSGKIYIGNSGDSIKVGAAITMDGATGIITATSFSGSGANLTALNASNLGSGTVPDGRFPATLPTASGVNLTALNASNLGSGTVPDARFPATLPAIDGSNLTGITADGVGAIGGLTVKNQNGAQVGTGGSISTIDFAGSTGVEVTATSGASGIATVKVIGPGADPTILSMIF